jgi:hypothetical protein
VPVAPVARLAHPAVIDATTGAVRYDNFEGRWGYQAYLDGFLQAYAVELARLTAERQSLLCREVHCSSAVSAASSFRPASVTVVQVRSSFYSSFSAASSFRPASVTWMKERSSSCSPFRAESVHRFCPSRRGATLLS